jgi:NAD(P)-dependent dehydrogenase (short-subunit alcohol dehydrogenase family)
MPSHSETLNGQCAIVSGGAGDIGAAIARELACRGAAIAIGDSKTPDEAQPRVESIRALGRPCHYTQLDVSDSASVVEWIERVEAELGLPDITIATAAVCTFKNISTISFEEWDREFEVNLDGYFYLARTVANRLVEEKKSGCIVLIGSAAADGVTLSLPTYCITKVAVRKLMECLSAHYARHGIRVVDVSPGVVDAGLSAAAMRENPSIRARAEQMVPTGELCDPEDIALAVAQLCEPDSHHFTGSTVYVDGGMRLKVIGEYDDA